jgi:hypothetical protein
MHSMKAWDDRGHAVRLKGAWLRSKTDASAPPPLKIGPEQIKRSDFFERKIAAELIFSLVLFLAILIIGSQFISAPKSLSAAFLVLLLGIFWRRIAHGYGVRHPFDARQTAMPGMRSDAHRGSAAR